jgi:hypothetical protein
MIRERIVYHFIIFSALFSFACSKGGSNLNEVTLDETVMYERDGVVLADSDSEKREDWRNAEPEQITLADKSELVTSYDSSGNKTEKRYFTHPRLKLVVVRTSTDGVKQVFVYGYGTDVKMMPEDFAETALTASATDIANAAGLTQNKPYKEYFASSTQTEPPVQISREQKIDSVETEREIAPTEPTQNVAEAEKSAEENENRRLVEEDSL